MDPKNSAQIDPKLKEAYDRVMGLAGSTPPSPGTPPPAPISTPSPSSKPDEAKPASATPPTIHSNPPSAIATPPTHANVIPPLAKPAEAHPGAPTPPSSLHQEAPQVTTPIPAAAQPSTSHTPDPVKQPAPVPPSHPSSPPTPTSPPAGITPPPPPVMGAAHQTQQTPPATTMPSHPQPTIPPAGVTPPPQTTQPTSSLRPSITTNSLRTPATTALNSTLETPKKSTGKILLFSLLALVFFAVYAIFWMKFLNYPLPF